MLLHHSDALPWQACAVALSFYPPSLPFAVHGWPEPLEEEEEEGGAGLHRLSGAESAREVRCGTGDRAVRTRSGNDVAVATVARRIGRGETPP